MKLSVDLSSYEDVVQAINLLKKTRKELGSGRDRSLIDELGLSVRSYNILRNAGIVNIGMLVQETDQTLLQIPNMGTKSLIEIKNKLDHYEHGFLE